ncbi:MAG: antibiotic biosynthesis monooxygenase [Anaerolineae bacterium]
MYGTVARMQIKPGAEAQLMALSKDYSAATVPGYVGEYIYRLDNEPNTYYMAVLFDSKEAYHANAQDPAQNERYMQMRALMASDPEWHDGEIISTPR